MTSLWWCTNALPRFMSTRVVIIHHVMITWWVWQTNRKDLGIPIWIQPLLTQNIQFYFTRFIHLYVCIHLWMYQCDFCSGKFRKHFFIKIIVYRLQCFSKSVPRNPGVPWKLAKCSAKKCGRVLTRFLELRNEVGGFFFGAQFEFIRTSDWQREALVAYKGESKFKYIMCGSRKI